MKEYNAYIDESGDEGFTVKEGEWKSSKWFFVGAVLVRKDNDLNLSKAINKIKTILEVPKNKWLTPLHFQKLKHNKRKVAINTIVNKGGFRIIIVGMDKRELETNSGLRHEHQVLYNYLTRFLLERVSWLVDERGGVCHLIFENRSATSYDELEEYIDTLFIDPRCQIRKHAIKSWSALNKSQSKNLQVADCVISGVANAFEEDKYGLVEPWFIEKMWPFFYRRGSNLYSYGLKLFPNPGNSAEVTNRYEWIRNK